MYHMYRVSAPIQFCNIFLPSNTMLQVVANFKTENFPLQNVYIYRKRAVLHIGAAFRC
jgi:hypothetical protein